MKTRPSRSRRAGMRLVPPADRKGGSASARTWSLSLAGLIFLTGCFSLSRDEPEQRHYVLGGSVLQENVAMSAELAGLTIGVRRIRLASYLDMPFLVVRRGAHQVTYADFHRWSEPLGEGINRAVAGHLAARTPLRAVDVAPWPAREQYDYVIQLHVDRFEGIAPEDPAALVGEIHLLATWEISRQLDGVVLARGMTDHRQNGWRVGDHAGLVGALDAGLIVLTDDLVRRLATLGGELTELR